MDYLEIKDQFTTHTYTLHYGRVVYSKGNEHIIDAVCCAMLVREQGYLNQVGEETAASPLCSPILCLFD